MLYEFGASRQIVFPIFVAREKLYYYNTNWVPDWKMLVMKAVVSNKVVEYTMEKFLMNCTFDIWDSLKNLNQREFFCENSKNCMHWIRLGRTITSRKPTVLHNTDKHKVGRFHKSYHLEVSRKVNTVNILTGTASSCHWILDKMSRTANFNVLVLSLFLWDTN